MRGLSEALPVSLRTFFENDRLFPETPFRAVVPRWTPSFPRMDRGRGHQGLSAHSLARRRRRLHGSGGLEPGGKSSRSARAPPKSVVSPIAKGRRSSAAEVGRVAHREKTWIRFNEARRARLPRSPARRIEAYVQRDRLRRATTSVPTARAATKPKRPRDSPWPLAEHPAPPSPPSPASSAAAATENGWALPPWAPAPCLPALHTPAVGVTTRTARSPQRGPSAVVTDTSCVVFSKSSPCHARYVSVKGSGVLVPVPGPALHCTSHVPANRRGSFAAIVGEAPRGVQSAATSWSSQNRAHVARALDTWKSVTSPKTPERSRRTCMRG